MNNTYPSHLKWLVDFLKLFDITIDVAKLLLGTFVLLLCCNCNIVVSIFMLFFQTMLNINNSNRNTLSMMAATMPETDSDDLCISTSKK